MAAPDRRAFLGHLIGVGAAAALAPASGLGAAREGTTAGAGLPPRAPAAPDEAYWGLVKESFPLRPGLALMNAANLCPSPFAVQDTVFRLTRDVDADPSFQNRSKFGALREASREAVAAHIGADPDEVAITRNTSEGNNTVVAGLELAAGDEVVLWDENHPTNSTSWDVRATREGFTVRRISTPPAPDSDGALLDAFRSALGPRTRVLAYSHVSNVSGVRLPAAELCALARARGITTLVDGAQSGGALRIDVREMGCDFFTASAHKWFTGPKEAGVLYVRAGAVEELWAADVGVGWERALEGGARKFETLGQRDDAAVAAVATAVDLHARVGADTIEARLAELTTALKGGIGQRVRGVTFHTPVAPSLSAGVVVFSVEGVNSREMYRALYDEHGIAGASNALGMRLSPHLYNTLAEMERAVEAVADIAAA